MVWAYKDGAFTPLDQAPQGHPFPGVPMSSLAACRAILSRSDEEHIEAAASLPEDSTGCRGHRRYYTRP